MNNELLKHQIALMLIPGVGNVTAKTLISYCGGVEEVFKAKKSFLLKIPEIGETTANAIIKFRDFDKAEKELEFIQKNKVQCLFYLDKDYPERLKHCHDGPLLLYFKGKCNLNHHRMIAIVGTRNMTEYGKDVCMNMVEDFEGADVVIVSGLAYGVDVLAHRESLKRNIPTVGVVGHGLNTMYPALHKSIAEKMMENGGVLTEFSSGVRPDPENFPARNRIVAGMVDAVVVIEASAKGGALITADIGNSYNRDVFAVPGRVNDHYSQGCNNLIKRNQAMLIESGKDVLQIMQWTESPKRKGSSQKKLFVGLNEEEQRICDIIAQKGSLTIDLISLHSKIPVSKVAGILLHMEFEGIIKSLPGKVYAIS